MDSSGSSSAMSQPSTGGYSGMGTTMIGGLTSAIGAVFGGSAQSDMYKYQAGIANFNAQIAQQNAEYATQIGEIQAQRSGLQSAQRMGQIKVAQAASGLDVNTGSAKAVQDSQVQLSRMDQTAIRSQAAKTAYNYQVEGVQYSAQAALDTVAAANARTSGFVNAASSLIGAASSVDSQWLRGQQLGMWGTTSGGSSNNQSFGA